MTSCKIGIPSDGANQKKNLHRWTGSSLEEIIVVDNHPHPYLGPPKDSLRVLMGLLSVFQWFFMLVGSVLIGVVSVFRWFFMVVVSVLTGLVSVFQWFFLVVVSVLMGLVSVFQ